MDVLTTSIRERNLIPPVLSALFGHLYPSLLLYPSLSHSLPTHNNSYVYLIAACTRNVSLCESWELGIRVLPLFWLVSKYLQVTSADAIQITQESLSTTISSYWLSELLSYSEMYLTHLKYIHTQRYTQWLNSLAVLVNIQLENSSHTHTLFLCLSEAKWSPSHIKQLSFISKSIFREIVISVSIHTDTHTSMQLLGKHCSHNLALSCPFHTR